MEYQSVGQVIDLFIAPFAGGKRKSLHSITLDQSGIVNDRFYGKKRERSVLISTVESYKIAKKNDIEIQFGELGENILLDYNPYDLPSGSRLNIGTAIIEITQYCTICEHLSAVDPILPQLLCNDRGIFAKVIKEGEISKGDNIYLNIRDRA